jgi:hypothetical protein
MIVVILIIGIMAGITVPAYYQSIERGRAQEAVVRSVHDRLQRPGGFRRDVRLHQRRRDRRALPDVHARRSLGPFLDAYSAGKIRPHFG